MTPIMASALSIVTGDAAHLARSATIVVAGACLSIALSFCIGLLCVAIDVSSNSQILSRTNPRPIALVIALATGAVGAFALAREDVSDTLSGVAIAISLVPPCGSGDLARGRCTIRCGRGFAAVRHQRVGDPRRGWRCVVVDGVRAGRQAHLGASPSGGHTHRYGDRKSVV